MIGFMLMACQFAWTQSSESRLKYEINGVMDIHRSMHRNLIAISGGSSVQEPRSFGSFVNMGIEGGAAYKLKEKHFITGRLGIFLTRSGTNLRFSPAFEVPSGSSEDFQSLIFSNASTRFELGHRYLFYDVKKVQMSLNSGLGLRYWNWNQTSEVSYFNSSVSPSFIPIGEYTSYSLRSIHLDLNLGLSIVFKDFFKHVDLSLGYSFLWAPLNAYRMDPIQFQDSAGFENQFQFDTRVHISQIRVGFVFMLGGQATNL